MSLTLPDASTRARQKQRVTTEVRQREPLTPDALELAAGTVKVEPSTVPRTGEPDNSRVDQQRQLDLADLLKALRAEQVAFKKLELREGMVLSTGDEWFRARLVDPEDEQPDEEVEILIEQVSPGDRGLIAPGALFFWAIGYVTRRGTRELVCKVTFRRRPAATHHRRRQNRALASAALDQLT